jgi:hypothetical protein
MAYFIFLKSLRSLEEFRKNPHVKIPPKYSCANFQSLAIFKNLIFIQKGIFFGFRPIRPSPAPQAAGSPLGPLGPSHVGVFSKRCILFDLTHSDRDVLSLSHHRHVGPACQLHPFLTPVDRCRFSSSSSATPRRPASPSDAARAITRPPSFPPYSPRPPLSGAPRPL